jgi:succinyl-diaminopimelate desuccinylase
MTLSDIEHAVVDCVDTLFDETVAFTQELIRVPTVNPPGEHYTDCANLIAERLRSFGYMVELLPADGLPEHSQHHPRINVIGRMPLSEPSGPTLHFNGHLDVVPPGAGWTIDPFAAEIRAGRLYGRGASDQKAGIAASVYAVEALRRSGVSLSGAVEQSASVDEESGGFAGVGWLCDHGLIQRGRQDYVVITEPLDPERVCIGHRGVYWFELTTLGQSGHGSMPGLAISAVEGMRSVLHAIETQLRPRLAARRTHAPVQPPSARQPTITVNAIHGGQALDGWQTPLVPDRCTAVFDRRFLHEEDFDEVRLEIVELLERLRQRDRRLRYELRDLMRVDPLLGQSDAPLVAAAAGAVRDVLGVEPVRMVSPGTYDHKHVVRRAGIADCIGYGPGRLTLAHQADEYIDLTDLRAGTRVMAVLALRLLEGGQRNLRCTM